VRSSGFANKRNMGELPSRTLNPVAASGEQTSNVISNVITGTPVA
jgi:hypothetical protein